jgi:hypothetical protein
MGAHVVGRLTPSSISEPMRSRSLMQVWMRHSIRADGIRRCTSPGTISTTSISSSAIPRRNDV